MRFVRLFVVLWEVWSVIYTCYHSYVNLLIFLGILHHHPLKEMADEYLDCMHHLNSVVSMANGFTRQQEARVKWERCAEMRGKTILLAAIWVRIGKCGGKVNVPHTWTDKLNACFESKPVSGRKYFRFCICVCRCASHVSSGYEPQFVFKLRFRFIERKMFMWSQVICYLLRSVSYA